VPKAKVSFKSVKKTPGEINAIAIPDLSLNGQTGRQAGRQAGVHAVSILQ
jgi:hypothetical protein